MRRQFLYNQIRRLSLAELNQNVLNAKYAVRGSIPIRADELSEQLKKDPKSLPFKKIIYANIGNPQQLDQKPLTWFREVLSVLQNPNLLDKGIYKRDVEERARRLLNDVKSLGAYSNSLGSAYVRKTVARFMDERDGFKSDPANIFLTNGASTSVSYLIDVLSTGKKSGFLIPIPQYPLYTASISLNGATPLFYYLNESNEWSTDPKQIKNIVVKAESEGIDVKALVVINPGNPTGALLSAEDIAGIIDVAAQHDIILIADEVYQNNIFQGEFVSVKKVLCELLEKDYEKYKHVKLASLNSTSKGFSGECGQRGGYMELFGFPAFFKDVIFKLASINLCSVVSGQALVDLLVNPPQEGEPSYELYEKESADVHSTLEQRANALFSAFKEMEDVSCNMPMGAMYLFPRLHFTESEYPELFKIAETKEVPVDEIYCLELLEKTGICTVPGSGFGQVPGTYHVRTTFLAPGSDWVTSWTDFHKKFVNHYKIKK